MRRPRAFCFALVGVFSAFLVGVDAAAQEVLATADDASMQDEQELPCESHCCPDGRGCLEIESVKSEALRSSLTNSLDDLGFLLDTISTTSTCTDDPRLLGSVRQLLGFAWANKREAATVELAVIDRMLSLRPESENTELTKRRSGLQGLLKNREEVKKKPIVAVIDGNEVPFHFHWVEPNAKYGVERGFFILKYEMTEWHQRMVDGDTKIKGEVDKVLSDVCKPWGITAAAVLDDEKTRKRKAQIKAVVEKIDAAVAGYKIRLPRANEWLLASENGRGRSELLVEIAEKAVITLESGYPRMQQPAIGLRLRSAEQDVRLLNNYRILTEGFPRMDIDGVYDMYGNAWELVENKNGEYGLLGGDSLNYAEECVRDSGVTSPEDVVARSVEDVNGMRIARWISYKRGFKDLRYTTVPSAKFGFRVVAIEDGS